MKANDIREKFLSYFESKKHQRVKSAALIPFNDPTLFFVNAGMVPFKDIFTGHEKRDYTRAVSSQKCMRVSGKHNDLENVGRTPRHHTFFEMLGNFSFGDYFKKEACDFAWEFLTDVLKLPAEPLWITIFRDDDEAEEIWKAIGIPADKIVRCDEKDNFWSMGATGPCGPCSEIHIDLSLYLDGKKAEGNPATHEENFMEIWNLVFMQFYRDESGKLTDLPKPSIDTGMGLERLATVLQKKRSNYETDLFTPLLNKISTLTSYQLGSDPEQDVSTRVIADHIRASVFLISDGVQPSNEGRGYVLRRIMRRAIRHGRLLNQKQAFFYKIVETLISEMEGAYPELRENQSFIEKVIQTEEERFLETLEKGLDMIDEEINRLQKASHQTFSGSLAFKLYDTFGFPVDLTELIAEEKGLQVDKTAFDQEMQSQKERAKAAWKGSGQEKVSEIYHQLIADQKTTHFAGYESMSLQTEVIALLHNGKLVNEISNGQKAEVFLKESPFYGESGGQVGDKGTIVTQNGQFEIKDTQKPIESLIAHHGQVTQGSLKIGDTVTANVEHSSRRATMLNHTATHILHAALRNILGDHVKQAGSLVDENRLRFDFSHFEAVSPEQLEAIEKAVNEVIQKNYPVSKEEMTFAEAQKKGALAFFGEKYGERVRVVTIGPYSMEFCGGTHLNASGEIGVFKIISESSVASGVRRIEAITGMKAVEDYQALKKEQVDLSKLLKATPSEIPSRLQKMTARLKDLEKELTQVKNQLATGVGGDDYLSKLEEVKGFKFLAKEFQVDDPKALRDLSDQVIQKIGEGVAVLVAKADGKAHLIVRVSKGLSDQVKAGDLIKNLAPFINGRGGGRPNMAQAGGDKVEGIPELLSKAKEFL